ncbi:hypothetical protein HN51_051932 [Arachis hypogaea]
MVSYTSKSVLKMEEFSSTFMTPITHIGPVRVAIVLRVLFCVQVGGQRLSFLPSVYTPGIRWMNWVSVIFQRLEGCLDRMPSFNHEERSMLVDLDGKDTFLVMLPGFAKERRQDPVLSEGEEKENATKFEFQTCLLASKIHVKDNYASFLKISNLSYV